MDTRSYKNKQSYIESRFHRVEVLHLIEDYLLVETKRTVHIESRFFHSSSQGEWKRSLIEWENFDDETMILFTLFKQLAFYQLNPLKPSVNKKTTLIPWNASIVDYLKMSHKIPTQHPMLYISNEYLYVYLRRNLIWKIIFYYNFKRMQI